MLEKVKNDSKWKHVGTGTKIEMNANNERNNNKSKINEISGEKVVDHFTFLSFDVDSRRGCESKMSKITQTAEHVMSKLNRI